MIDIYSADDRFLGVLDEVVPHDCVSIIFDELDYLTLVVESRDHARVAVCPIREEDLALVPQVILKGATCVLPRAFDEEWRRFLAAPLEAIDGVH